MIDRIFLKATVILSLAIGSAAASDRPDLEQVIQSQFPGYDVGQVVTGPLIRGGVDEVVALIYKNADSDATWPISRLIVLSKEESSGYVVRASSCPEEYNPKNEEDIAIERGSLFVRMSFPGMETSESIRSQYRWDGARFRLIGTEESRSYFGDDPARRKDGDHRSSVNHLTGDSIEYRARGAFKARTKLPASEYLECPE